MGTVKPCVVRSDATCFPGHPLQPWVQGDVALCCGTELAQTQRLLLGTMSIRLLQQQRSVNSDASAWSRDPRGTCDSFPDRVPCAAVSSVPVASHHVFTSQGRIALFLGLRKKMCTGLFAGGTPAVVETLTRNLRGGRGGASPSACGCTTVNLNCVAMLNLYTGSGNTTVLRWQCTEFVATP